jgi:hypothetical protein
MDYGGFVRSCGDLDGDGAEELVVMYLLASDSELRFAILSPAQRELLRELSTPMCRDPERNTHVGDMEVDGKRELVIASDNFSMFAIGNPPPHLSVFSLSDGSRRLHFALERFSVVAPDVLGVLPDQDHDGVNELLLAHRPEVWVASGATADVLYELPPEHGSVGTVCEDLDGDHAADFVLATRRRPRRC